MANSLREPSAVRHHERLETVRPRMAKALNKVETAPMRTLIGQAIARAFALANLSQKEAAALIGRDTAQIARWISGEERAQMDALFAVEALRRPLVVAFAEVAGRGVEVVTEIRVSAGPCATASTSGATLRCVLWWVAAKRRCIAMRCRRRRRGRSVAIAPPTGRLRFRSPQGARLPTRSGSGTGV